MKNLLAILRDHLFEQIEKLNDPSLSKKELEREIKKAGSLNAIASAAITEARELL